MTARIVSSLMTSPLIRLGPVVSLLVWSQSVALERSDVTSIEIDPVAYDAAPLREVLEDVWRLAAARNIQLTNEGRALEVAGQEPITLTADGLTLDALLEFATRATGTEWKIEDDGIVVFSTNKIREAHRARRASEIRQALDQIVIPEIAFDDMPFPDAYEKVRRKALGIAGLGAVPKLDVAPLPDAAKIGRLEVKDASVLTLFELLASVSVSRVDWEPDGFVIAVYDEARRREEKQSRDIARRNAGAGGGGGGAVDPFSAPSPSLPQRPRRSTEEANPFLTESYDHFGDNPFLSPHEEPRSTFSIDVDTASYTNVRRLIQSGSRVPVDATRIEEFVNYFTYDYAPPAVGKAGEPVEGEPFAVHLDAASAPWAPEHRLVRIGLKGYDIDWESRPPSNLAFLIDVSGSMNAPNKLELVKESLEMLLGRLDERDRISIAVYAGDSGLVLPPTPANRKRKILEALGSLEAGGSTNAGEGIALAYKTVREQFNQLGNNRVILCTDGDFNVGITDRGSLVEMVEEQAQSGVYLTVLGFGMGNYKDDMLETLSNKGNGNYGYIDSSREARRVFVSHVAGTLMTIAEDVKMQVEFNPSEVGAYRLLGYENRLLETRDFDDDTKDAGEIGAGHSVTAFYEIVPPGMAEEILKAVSPLKYQQVERKELDPDTAGELLTLKLRYKEPGSDQSELITIPFTDGDKSFAEASRDFRFAASVAAFGMILRDSEYRGESTLPLVLEASESAAGEEEGARREFVELVRTYQKHRAGK